MDLNDVRSTCTIKMESMKATMNAMRSQLEQEKTMLKNDIEETLKCQSVLRSGSADLLYTSKLLARLKSLEDNRKPLREAPPKDHAGTIPAYCLKGRAEDEAREFGGAGELHHPIYSTGRSFNCVRHCCSLNSAQVLKSTSGLKAYTPSSQTFPVPSTSMHNSSLPRVRPVSRDTILETNVEPYVSWSGDVAAVHPIFKESQPHHPTHYNQCPYTPSCTCVPNYSHCIPEDIPADPCNRHCIYCSCLPEKQCDEIVQEDRWVCGKKSCCRHSSPRPGSSLRSGHYSHHHEKAPRYNRHHQMKKESDAGVDVSAGDIDESRETDKECVDVEANAIEEEQVQVGNTDFPQSSKVNVTPRSSSLESIQSGKTLAEETTRDTGVQYHYANELSSQKSGGSSLFGSEITFDQAVHQPCTHHKTKLRSSKTRRRGKRTARDPPIGKSGGDTLPPEIERTRSNPHPLQLPDADTPVKATSATASHELSRGHRKKRNSSNKSRWSRTELLLLPPSLLPPPMHHSLPPPNPRKKLLRNDHLKPLETFYASLTGMPKNKRSQRGGVDDRSKVQTPVPELTRKTSKTTRPANPFSLILDELSSSPMLRSMGLPRGRNMPFG